MMSKPAPNEDGFVSLNVRTSVLQKMLLQAVTENSER